MSVAALQQKTQQGLYAYRHYIIGLAALLLAMAVPQLAMADAWDGGFGPSDTMSKNIFVSIQAWWKNIAAWLLYGGLVGLAVSVFAFGGQYWKQILFVIGIALVGEMVITWVIDIAGLGAGTTSPTR